MAELTTEQVWKAIGENIFAVLGMVTAKNEPRTVGIVYVAHDYKLYIASKSDAWKVRHLAQNPHVSLTVAIPKRVPLMPWIKVPAATITFGGTATVVPAQALDSAIARLLFRVENGPALEGASAIIVEPKGEFVTYGIGVSLMEMRDTVKARGRAPVS